MLFNILILLALLGVLGAVVKIYSDAKRNRKYKDMVREMEEERKLKKGLEENQL